jgi:hypothetical protein
MITLGIDLSSMPKGTLLVLLCGVRIAPDNSGNNWGQLGRWDFHVCHNPQLLEKELAYLIQTAT